MQTIHQLGNTWCYFPTANNYLLHSGLRVKLLLRHTNGDPWVPCLHKWEPNHTSLNHLPQPLKSRRSIQEDMLSVCAKMTWRGLKGVCPTFFFHESNIFVWINFASVISLNNNNRVLQFYWENKCLTFMIPNFKQTNTNTLRI